MKILSSLCLRSDEVCVNHFVFFLSMLNVVSEKRLTSWFTASKRCCGLFATQSNLSTRCLWQSASREGYPFDEDLLLCLLRMLWLRSNWQYARTLRFYWVLSVASDTCFDGSPCMMRCEKWRKCVLFCALSLIQVSWEWNGSDQVCIDQRDNMRGRCASTGCI